MYPSRKPLRLPHYDYSAPGAYFVTVCTKDRQCLLSMVTVGDGVLDIPQVSLSAYGRTVEDTIQGINRHYDHIRIEKHVIMPNHIHLLLHVTENGPSGTPAPTNAAVPMLVSFLKRFSNKQCGISLWQRGYYEHIIRSEKDYLEIWTYIDQNPAKWAEDRYFHEN